MRKRLIGVALVATLGTPAGAADASPKSAAELAAAFGARPAINQISLSPDGTKVAIIAPIKGRGSALVIGDLAKGDAPKPVLTASGDPDRLSDCHWSTNSRLICRIYMITTVSAMTLPFTRIVAVDADGKNLKELSARANDRTMGFSQNGGTLIDWGSNDQGSALMTRTFLSEATTGTMISNNRQGLGVELVDTVSLARKTVEQANGEALEYISDGQGNVRIMGIQPRSGTGYNGNRVLYSYRKAGSREWLPLGTLQIDGTGVTGFNPYAVDPSLNVVYGFDDQNGRRALFSISLDGTLTRKLVFARPDVDVDDLIEVGRNNRVVGAAYVTDRRHTEFFDPVLKGLQAPLGKALPGRLVSFVDTSSDENRVLLFAGSDVDPGHFYLFDRKARSLGDVGPVRPEMAGVALAAVRPVTYKAADGTEIPAYLTLPAGSGGKDLPAIVMPHGGPGARDEWGFDWLAQFFAARGFAVIQPNFRGSAGYGEDWYQKNGFQSWRTAIGDVNDAGRWLIKSGVADPSRLAIVGWSYGGYAALQSSVLDPDLFKAVVAIAPVTDLETLRGEARNFTNYKQVDAFIGRGAWVTEGSPARNAQRIKAPVLLFHGDRDMNVGIGESRLMADRLKAGSGKAELVEFKGLDHQLDDDTARSEMLVRADAFLRASMGMTP